MVPVSGLFIRLWDFGSSVLSHSSVTGVGLPTRTSSQSLVMFPRVYVSDWRGRTLGSSLRFLLRPR